MAAPDSTPSAAAPPAAPPARPRRARWPLAVAAAIAVPVAAAAAGWAWLHSSGATAWLARQVPGLVVEDVDGSLLGGPLAVRTLRWAGPDGAELRIDGLAWGGIAWGWRPHEGAWIGLQLQGLRAEQVHWQGGTPGGEPAAAPATLALPLRLSLPDVAIARLQVGDAPALTDIALAAELGAVEGRRHRIDRLAATIERVRVDASGHIETAAPLALELQATATPADAAAGAWQAQVQASGPLARIDARGALRSREPAAALDATATVTPFAGWPLQALAVGTERLDLAAFSADAPTTSLSGRAVIDSSGLDAPVQAEITLTNAAAGRWDQRRLPLSALQATLRGRPSDRSVLEMPAFTVRLGSAAEPAGVISGNGRWAGHTMTLALGLDALRPQRLDARAPALSARGPVALTLGGLPLPDPGAPAAGPLPPRSVALDTRLQGALDAAATAATRAVSVAADAAWRAQGAGWQADVRALEVRAGDARLQASGRVQRAHDRAPWQVRAQARVAQLDPMPWWPAAAAAPWAAGPHRLNGEIDADVTLPAAPGSLDSLPRLAALPGRVRLTLADSVLAGLPLQARLDARQTPDGPVADAEATLAGNQATARWQGRPGSPQARAELTLEAGALAALAPLAPLHPALQPLATLAGAAQGRADITGTGRMLQSRGELAVTALRSGNLTLPQGRARWNLSLPGADDGPLELTLDADGLAQGSERLDRVRLAVDGRWRAHRLTAEVAGPWRPPEWVDGLAAGTGPPPAPAAVGSAGNAAPAAVAGAGAVAPARGRSPGTAVAAPAGTAIELRAEGRWAPEGTGSRWVGRVAQAQAGAWGQGGMLRPWLRSSGVDIDMAFDAGGRPRAARAEPGRLEVLGIGLRWRSARWEAPALAGQPPQIDVDADLEPVPVASWLARAMPDFGWRGNLTVGGRLRLASGERTEAEVLLERTGGDLQVQDGDAALPLGLTELRLALNVRDGTWAFSQGLAGERIGVLGGAQVVRTSAQAVLPPADAPLEGVLELRVANLGVWAPWVPPGWRLGGQLRTSASFGGTLGAPEYTGEMAGSRLAVANPLQGVDVRDGELQVALRGARATVERFSARAGPGELTITGDADFGADPRLRLQLQASRFQVLGRVDRRVVASGQARMTAQPSAMRLDGRFTVDEGLFDFTRGDAPGLDADVVVVRPGQPGVPEVDDGTTAPPARGRNVALDLKLDLGERLTLRGRGLETRLRGQLAITNPGGRLAVNGTVRTHEGTYAAYGQKLEIERGIIDFSGVAEDPRLDVVALRAKTDLRVGVAIGGSAQNPRVRLFSDPEMSEVDKLSYLLVGRSADGLGRADTALLQRAALALLAGEGEGLTDSLINAIGLDEFSVRQDESGNVRETVVSVGKQLSRRWYVGYERSVNATEGTLQLIYRVAQRFTLRAQSGASNAVDVIWTWRWN